MDVLLLLVMGAVNILCFMIGAKVGQTVIKGEKVEMPSVNPLNIIQEQREKKKAQAEQERIDVILNNIECYDGTGRGQEDVPGR